MKSLEYKVGALIVVSLVLLGGFLCAARQLLVPRRHAHPHRLRLLRQPAVGRAGEGLAASRSARSKSVRFLGGEMDPDTGKRVQVRVVACGRGSRQGVDPQGRRVLHQHRGRARRAVPRDRAGHDWDQPPLDPSHSVEGVNPPRTDSSSRACTSSSTRSRACSATTRTSSRTSCSRARRWCARSTTS